MPGTQRVRGNVNVVLNRLVREGIITSFKTNFGWDNETTSPHVTVTVPEGQPLEVVQTLVIDAVMEAGIGIDVTAEGA